MQEQLDRSKKNEPEDAKSPSQDNDVRARIRCVRESRNVEPEARDPDRRNGINDYDPQGKSARLDRTATTELDRQKDGKDRRSSRAGQRPRDCVGQVEEIQKLGSQRQGGDEEATFNIQAHKAEVPIGELASQGTAKRDDHCRETYE